MDAIRDSLQKFGNSANAIPSGLSTHSGNTYSINCTPDYILADKKEFIMLCDADSTGAVSLNPDGSGIKAGLKPNGLPVTNLKKDGLYKWIYNATKGNFTLLGEGGDYGTVDPSQVLNTATVGTENGTVPGTIVPRPDKTVNNLVTGAGISMRNIFYNGNFSIGDPSWWACANWEKVNTADTFTTSNCKATFKASAAWGGIYQRFFDIPAVGDKIYIKADVKSPYAAGVGLMMSLEHKEGVALGLLYNTSVPANTTETISAIWTIPSDFVFSEMKLKFKDISSSGWQNCEVTNVVGVNLTKTFGAGAEPTKAQMDTMIASLGGFFMVYSHAPKAYTISNLILQNPEFESDLASWSNTIYCTVVNTKARITNKSLKIAIPSAQAYAAYQGISNFGATGHKLYCCGWCNIESQTNALFRIQLDDWDGSSSASNAKSSVFSTIGSWQFGSVCLTSTKSGARVELIQDNALGYGTCYFDALGLFDLTAIFGAGNEPTQAQMDSLILSLGGYVYSARSILGIKIPKGAYLNDNQEVLLTDSCLTPAYLTPQFNSFGMQGTATSGDNTTPYELLPTKTATVKGMGISGACTPKVSNILKNGSFESLLNGWVFDSPSNSYDPTITKASFSSMPDGGNTAIKLYMASGSTATVISSTTLPIVAGHVYYSCGWFLRKGTLNGAGNVCDMIGSVPEVPDSFAITNASLPNLDQWYLHSGIVTATAGNYIFRIFTYSTEPLYVDCCMLIDLTESFGAGKEPTKAVMDAIVTNSGKNWWDSNLYNLTNDSNLNPVNVINTGVYYSAGLRLVGSMPDKRDMTLTVQDASATHLPSVPDGFGGSGTAYYGKIKIKLDSVNTGCLNTNSILEQYIYGLHPNVVRKGYLIGPTGSSLVGTYDPSLTMKNFYEASVSFSGTFPVTATVTGVNFTPTRVFVVVNGDVAIGSTTTGGNDYNIFSNMGGLSRNIASKIVTMSASVSMNGTTATITLSKSGSSSVATSGTWYGTAYLYG